MRKLLSATLLVFLMSNTALADNHSAVDKMISPISNPINFEDPRITTELRPFYAFHELNNDFVTEGGQVQAWAAQARIAITERLGFIAVKDGYIENQYDAVLDDDGGALNLEAGLKYAFYKTEHTIISGGLKYQIASGSPDIFQGRGDGIITPFITGGTHVGGFNFIGMTQVRAAVNGDDSSFWDLSLHADYPLLEQLFPTLELNLFHVYNGGDRTMLPGEGADLLNIGANGADGDTTVNLAVGTRYRFCDWIDGGIAFEFPLTNGEDVFGERLYVDVIFKALNWNLVDALS